MKRKQLILAFFAVFLSAAARLHAADTVTLQAADADGSGANGTQILANRNLVEGATFHFVPELPIVAGGSITLQIPSNWAMPTIDSNSWSGYVDVTAASVPLTNFTVNTTGYYIIIDVKEVGIPEMGYVEICYHNPWIQWNTQSGVKLPATMRHGPTEPTVEINPPLTVDVVAGPPANVTFDTWGLVVEKGKPSKTPVKVHLVDNAWITTTATATVQIDLSGRTVAQDTVTWNSTYDVDPTAEFSLSTAPWSPITQLPIVSGASGAEFFYRSSATTNNTIIRLTNNLNGYANYYDMWVNVISEGISNARIHKGDYSNGTSTVIGVNETAYIDFNLGSNSMSWQVIISTSPDRSSAIWTYWGNGTPMQGQVTWSGNMSYYDPVLGYWRGERAPKGTYYVRIQLNGGGIVDDSLSLTLQSLEITGRVTDKSGNPVAGGNVYCYGPSYANGYTDADGNYVLSGLMAGSYNISFQKYGYSNVWVNGVNAGETKDIKVFQPSYVRINAHRGVSTDTVNSEYWGNVQLIPRDGSSNAYWGSLHFAVDVSTSDNGGWVYDQSINRYEIDNSTGMQGNAGKWTTLEVVPGSYTLRADMYGYDTVERQIYVSTSMFISDIVFAPRTVVTGLVRLAVPPTESWGTWVSVEAVPSGSQNGTFWGGASIPQSMSSGMYVVNGLPAGTYTLRASAQGYRRGSATITVAPGQQFVYAPNITLAESGSLVGTVTVEGDTTDPSLNFPTMNGKYNFWINAWSPDTYNGGGTQVYVSTSTTVAVSSFTLRGVEDGAYWINTWLQGFDLQDAVGWNGVRATVSGGLGIVNLKFKRYSARIQCTFRVPDNDYDNLLISISGQNIGVNDVRMSDILARNTAGYGIAFDTHTGVMTTPPLTTGFFQVRGKYAKTGFMATKSMMTVSGRTSYMGIDLTAQTYSIAGRVSISASNPPTGFTDIALLVSSAPANNTVYIDGSTTSFRVYALDYEKTMESSSDSSGGTAGGAAATANNNRSGVINEDGTFVVTGLVPGAYVLQIPALELDGNYGNGKETADTEKVVHLSAGMSNIAMEVSKGYTVRGQVKLPAGETATRSFNMELRKPTRHTSTRYIGNIQVSLTNANAGDYEIKGLAAGTYVLTVNDCGYSDMSQGGRWMPAQYASTSLYVKVEASDVNGQNMQLGKGGKIAFKLRDADSGTIITPANRDRMLPSSFNISAQASPWIEGGWANSGDSNKFGSDSSSTTFEMRFLPEAIYDLKFDQSSGNSSSMGGSISSGSGATYASKVLSGIKVRNGQTIDIGTVDIKQGITLAGTVTDRNNNPLPNIPLIAIPSLSNDWQTTIYGFTDANGKYSITGLNPDYPYYDFIACPRMKNKGSSAAFFYGAGGIMYGEKTRPMIKLSERPAVNFVLDDAKGSIIGKVVTDDGGKLQSMDDPNLQCGYVMLQMENTVPRENPIGDIEVQTDVDGAFLVEALSPGTYNLCVISSGYLSERRSVTVGSDQVDLGTLTLRHGARVSGSITGVDGKSPSSSAVEVVAAATEDFGEIVMGTVKKTGENIVTGYELAGFQPGTIYNIMFFGENAEGIPALMNYSVPYSTYVKTDMNLVYKIAEPSIFTRATRDGNRYTVYFELSSALRKSLPADELDQIVNPNQTIVTVVAGKAANLAYPYLSPDRKKIICVYTADAGETSFSLRLRAFAKTINPATGTEFGIDERLTFYSGIAAQNRAKVSTMKGGRISLEGDPSCVMFPSGAFEVGGSTSSVFVDFSRADSFDELHNAAPANGAPRLTIPRAAPAYPNKLYTAMQAAQSAGVSAFSAFYDVMLPQGVSRALKKDATLTLQFASSVDPSTLNIYYYDETNKVYLLESKGRLVNGESKTISVNVNHASVFVVLQSNAAVIQGTTYNGPLFVYNFPNPFNLEAKTVGLTHPTMNRSTSGTMLHYGLPSDISGEVEIKIYNIAGELVRTINDGVRTGGYHYYTEWDGKNDNDKKVASGVYICRFTVDKKHEKFFKMAVVK